MEQGRRILIVDDDAVVLGVVAHMTAVLGYRTAIAADALEALAVLAEEPFDLVVTDYNMPFMDGYQLAVEIGERFPGTRVIIMTGSGLKEWPVLLKPFTLDHLRERIDQTLALPVAAVAPRVS